MEDKRALRAVILQARARRSPADLAEAGGRLAGHGLAAAAGCRVVAAHAAVGTEPPTRALVEALRTAGVRVLLPRVDGHALRWGELGSWGELRQSPLGLLEPAQTTQAHAAAAAAADLILLPALAVDRAGHRLGRGGGYYDRWLPAKRSGRAVAVLFDEEVVDEVPTQPHDRPVDAVLTPSGLLALRQ